jgi:hypothetical protein
MSHLKIKDKVATYQDQSSFICLSLFILIIMLFIHFKEKLLFYLNFIF